MRSPQPSTVVIACPHCGTRYQVPPETLGRGGRQVSCAHCGQAWRAEPPPPPEDDRLFTPSEEEALDRAFTALEKTGESPAAPKKPASRELPPPPEVVKSIAEIRQAIAPKVDDPPGPAEEHKPTAAEKVAKGKLDKRQRDIAKALPAVRLFRGIRFAAVLLLFGVVTGGYWFRTEIVRLVPDLAGLYAAVGLRVNVVGLEFSDISTVMSRRGDSQVVSVTAKIRAVAARRVAVPPVVVSLLDEQDTLLYQWSVIPRVADVQPGEAIEFAAELPSPPPGATQVKLGFSEGRQRAVATAAPADTPSQGGAPPEQAPPPDTSTDKIEETQH